VLVKHKINFDKRKSPYNPLKTAKKNHEPTWQFSVVSLTEAVLTAFSDNGELLGVVGINLFKTKLLQVYGIDGDAIEGAVKLRSNPEINFNASTDLTTPTCLNQVLLMPPGPHFILFLIVEISHNILSSADCPSFSM